MTTYKGIKGIGVQSITTDAISSQIGGGSWATATSMPGTRQVGFSAGTQTANVVSGGTSTAPANSNQINTTVEYD